MEPEPQPIHAWKRRLAFLQEQEAVVSDPAQKFTLRVQIEKAQAKLRELAGSSEETAPALQLDLGRLPIPGPHFVGRDTELARLDAPWEDPAIHVLTLVAVQDAEQLNRAVDGLRLAGTEDHLPRGLLVRAALRRFRSDFTGAVADLAEALEIAERGPMRLHECDAHLEWARLCRNQGDLAEARRHVARARVLVNETGYGRREREVRWLEGAVGA